MVEIYNRCMKYGTEEVERPGYCSYECGGDAETDEEGEGDFDE
jgi:hypothetical protein